MSKIVEFHTKLPCEVTSFVFPGSLRFLLGLQCRRSSGGTTEEDHGSPEVPQLAEPLGLLAKIWKLRVQRRLYDQRLRVRHPEQRHRIWGDLPIRRQGEPPHNVDGWNFSKVENLDFNVCALFSTVSASTTQNFGPLSAPATDSYRRGTRRRWRKPSPTSAPSRSPSTPLNPSLSFTIMVRDEIVSFLSLFLAGFI